MTFFQMLLAAASGCALFVAGASNAADWSAPQSEGLPAVSDINAKVAAGFGSLDGDGVGLVAGSVTVPLSHAYGFQVDGMAASVDGAGAVGIAGHGFWRDPGVGLLGAYASYLHYEGTSIDLGHVGVEAEAYIGRVSLEGVAGVEFGDGDVAAFGSAGLAYYPVDDLRLYAGYRFANETGSAAAGAEWQPGLMSGLAVFADGRMAAGDRWSVLGGIRFYIGEDKSLIRRHREDDPVNSLLPDDLFGVSEEPAPAPCVEPVKFSTKYSITVPKSCGEPPKY